MTGFGSQDLRYCMERSTGTILTASYFHEALVNSATKHLDAHLTVPVDVSSSVLSSAPANIHKSVPAVDDIVSNCYNFPTVNLAAVNPAAESSIRGVNCTVSSFPQRLCLPDSPPDSGSEPSFSPPHEESKVNQSNRNPQIVTMQSGAESLKHFIGYNSTQPLKHLPIETSLTVTPPLQQSPQQPGQISMPTHTGNRVPHLPIQVTASSGHMTSELPPTITNALVASLGISPHQSLSVVPPSNQIPNLYNSDEILCENISGSDDSNPRKKRKFSDSAKTSLSTSLLKGMVSIKQEPNGVSPGPATLNALPQPEDEYSIDFSNSDTGGMLIDTAYQCIRFQPFQQNTWHVLCDASLKELPPFNYRVDADKGFNFSYTDDSFVCQKKNHFQVTVHVQSVGDPQFIKTPDGLRKIENFYLHFYGVKMESQNQTIKVEQSQSDRSKQPFHPVQLEIIPDQVTKTTIGRLHFSETTSNNMRKKGKPNPDQRYFYLVVSICAHVGDQAFPVVCYSSEKIIVRASNPGQFENDVELSWQKGQTPDSIFHAGRVGINTDRPDEPLVVHGNMKITGHIMQPSDARVKTNTTELDSREQLKNVSNMRVIRFRYRPEFAQQAGLSDDAVSDTGVIAQEISSILPDAVKEAGDISLPNGQTIENFLVVNKERIFMENVGAVKELCKVTDNLETRIDELERINRKLKNIKRFDSLKSTSSGSTVTSRASSVTASQKSHRHHNHGKQKRQNICSNRFVQGTIIALVLIMAFCLVAMATLYILEWQKRHSSEEKARVDISKYTHGAPLFNHSMAPQELSFSIQPPSSQNPFPSHGIDLSSTLQQNVTSVPTSYPLTPNDRMNRKPIGLPTVCSKASFSPDNCPQICCDVEPEIKSDNAEMTFPTANKSTDSVYGRQVHEERSLNFNNTAVATSRSDHVTPSSGITFSQTRKNVEKSSSMYTNRFASLSPSNEVNNELNQNPFSANRNGSTQSNVRSQQSTDHNSNIGEISVRHKINPKTILIEKRNSKVHPVSSGNPHKRSKRERTSDVVRFTSKPHGRKSQLSELVNTVGFIRLPELNTTLGLEYCVDQCTNGPWFIYDVPVSRYMTLDYVTLQFNLSQSILMELCTFEEPKSCINVKPSSSSRQEGTGHSFMPCLLQSSDAGQLFVEYKFIFHRDCGI
ncbi:myelin regulatory factor-like isoform X2 [Limulus polyphemus]|uniref:Myelin regulatory factor-like isoform X2 n=1 Tax=Limulus polyphemus TaxID=6850 RepID=A0ABM1T1J1_LIMPO|nr:myelin regulatory factor-like isoform X2 [Limulus polyphemus]